MTTTKRLDTFGEFAPAYTISNEDQRWATRAVPGVKKVLTVAGSGDQALFYHLNGAGLVHTFDITYNARVIQDIKVAAIQKMNPREYVSLLMDLYFFTPATSLPSVKKLLPLLPGETTKIINTAGNNCIFGAGLDASQYPKNIPTAAEFAHLKNTLKKPFKFTQGDLYNLSAKISDKYDLINISNIFDYCYDGKAQAEILHNLGNNLNIGGYIAYLPQVQRFSYDRLNLTTPQNTVQYAQTLRNKDSKMILFQRTR